MKLVPDEMYLEKAKLLAKDDAEGLLERMRGKLTRRLSDHKLTPLEAIAIQLELEDRKLQEWRKKYAEIREKHKHHDEQFGHRTGPSA